MAPSIVRLVCAVSASDVVAIDPIAPSWMVSVAVNDVADTAPDETTVIESSVISPPCAWRSTFPDPVWMVWPVMSTLAEVEWIVTAPLPPVVSRHAA